MQAQALTRDTDPHCSIRFEPKDISDSSVLGPGLTAEASRSHWLAVAELAHSRWQRSDQADRKKRNCRADLSTGAVVLETLNEVKR